MSLYVEITRKSKEKPEKNFYKNFKKTLDIGLFISYSSLTVCDELVNSKWTLTTAYCKSKTNI